MLEWGQPIFLYDFDKLKQLTKKENPEITVRFATCNEIFIDSNLRQYSLTDQTLVIVAENIPISIAGSTVSKSCFVDELTTNILIQASIFDAKVFRKSERSIGLRTDASVYYERGINKYLTKASLNMFLNLIFLLETNFLNKIDVYVYFFNEQKALENIISISSKNIEKILGKIEQKNNINTNLEVINCLTKLNFKFSYRNSIFFVNVPLTRISDIEEEIDLIEEISRFYGFNKFKAILPKYKKIGKLSRYETLKRKFRECFINLGFSEVYTYSFIPDNLLNTPIINPLTKEYSSLRSNFIPQLIKLLEKNINQTNKIFPIFEIGHSFLKNNFNNTFLENELICAIFGGNNYRVSWSTKEIQLDWFQAKYFLETIFKNLELKVNFLKPISVPEVYHPQNCLNIFYKNEEIGYFGKINPKLCVTKGLPKNCFLFELEFTKILKLKEAKKPLVYKTYSIYPSLSVDLSLLVPITINFSQIVFVINKSEKNLIEKIELFDVYEKFDQNNEYYSLGLKIIFKSKQKTLLKLDVDAILLKIEKDLKKDLNISIRI
jgi:phenylalanyl-tRNA synthetase beta chain